MSVQNTHSSTKNPLINFLILRNNDSSKLQINNIKKNAKTIQKTLIITGSRLKESHER